MLLILFVIVYLLIGCAGSKSHKTLIRATLYGKWGSSSVEATDVDSVKIDTVLAEIKK